MWCVKIRKKKERKYKLKFIISTFGRVIVFIKFDFQTIICYTV